MNTLTQIESARKGIITKEVKIASAEENMSPETMRERLSLIHI